jgi:hypothetical protein
MNLEGLSRTLDFLEEDYRDNELMRVRLQRLREHLEARRPRL